MNHIISNCRSILPILGCLVIISPEISAQDTSMEGIFWETTDCDVKNEILAYLEQFPDGVYATQAKACLEKSGGGNTDNKINELLSTCNTHLEERRLTIGAGGNALECYKQVLGMDPDNEDAKLGLRKIEDKYAAWTEIAVDNEDLITARANLKKLKDLNPNYGALSSIQNRIDALAAEQNQQDELDSQQQQIERDNAYWANVQCDKSAQLTNYKKLFPSGIHVNQANQCLKKVRDAEDTYVNWIQSAIDAKNPGEANINFERLSNLNPNHASLAQFRKRIDAMIAQEKVKKDEQDRKRVLRERDNSVWTKVNCDNIDSVNRYKNQFPDGIHTTQANECIKKKQAQKDAFYGDWSGKGTDIIILKAKVKLSIRDDEIIYKSVYPNGSVCDRRLIPETSLDNIKIGDTVKFRTELLAGTCFKTAVYQVKWKDKDSISYKWFKGSIRGGVGKLSRDK